MRVIAFLLRFRRGTLSKTVRRPLVPSLLCMLKAHHLFITCSPCLAAFSPSQGLLAVPHRGRDVRIYAIDGTSASLDPLTTLCQPSLEPTQAVEYVLGVAWGPFTVCPRKLAVAYPGYIALWSVEPARSPTGETSSANATYCSSFALSRFGV